MVSSQLSFLTPGAARYAGTAERYVQFTMQHQLLDASTWKKFVRVFTADSDDHDLGWRCEYWGKMMRGACLIYMYNRSDELYAVLEETVRDLLKVQREDGRFSSYSRENQLQGWDMWGRKYVLTALLHFYRICRSEKLKKEILNALCVHVDAVISSVGAEEGKADITKTSNYWLGVNSCSILDAVLDLYCETGEKRYLEFGEYIISTGGIEGGNLIELAEQNRLMPFEYPETKAYETISFFEGLLTYYQITGNERYKKIVEQFVEAVNDTDITIIGCAGCTHELFDHSKLKQARYSDTIMQETCVTVTWMRMMAKLHLLTGEQKYFDRLEQSAYNALYGSVNENNLKQYSIPDDSFEAPLPFDSYSPLYNNVRGRGIGGFKRFSFGGAYGCCACIASAGIALLPLCAVLKNETGFLFNGLIPGTVSESTPGGQPAAFHVNGSYPAVPEISITVSLKQPEMFALKIRIPPFMKNAALTVNGKSVSFEGESCTLKRCWNDGDTVSLTACYELQTETIEGRTAFTYGPLVLAADTAKENTGRDLTEEISLKSESGKYCLHMEEPCEKYHETIRIALERADGKEPLLLTDYASCGKNWNLSGNRMTVWMNISE